MFSLHSFNIWFYLELCVSLPLNSQDQSSLPLVFAILFVQTISKLSSFYLNRNKSHLSLSLLLVQWFILGYDSSYGIWQDCGTLVQLEKELVPFSSLWSTWEKNSFNSEKRGQSSEHDRTGRGWGGYCHLQWQSLCVSLIGCGVTRRSSQHLVS